MTHDDGTPRPTRPTARRWRPAVVGAFLVVVLAGGATAIVVTRDDGPSRRDAQVAEVHRACDDWVASRGHAGGPDQRWCTAWSGWMEDHMGQGPGDTDSMPGAMMGAGSRSVRDECDRWMRTSPAGTSGDAEGDWCGDMAAWMGQRAGG